MSDDRKLDADITPEMLRAGVDAYRGAPPGASAEAIVSEIYGAMREAFARRSDLQLSDVEMFGRETILNMRSAMEVIETSLTRAEEHFAELIEKQA